MVQTLLATQITLRDLIDRFGLRLVRDDQFFREWQDNLPEITDSQKQFLDQIKEGYFNLIDCPPLLEKAIQISVVSPILFLAGFYLAPFQIRAEESVEIVAEEDDLVIRGQLDILLIKEQFWVMVIETKRAAFSIEAGLAQLLAYMLANPHPHKSGFGLITTGGSFMFIKLAQNDGPRYATSKIFELRNPGNDLYDVFRILKHISEL
ncbi:MAG: restriction endonuclease subunit R [Acaryochloris sp. RU_4_1]|nr:restriction endonuclease subunit R [Acaryochloris sp. RU_4_1]NJN39383.1 restriction endonuclease subunit R [Acaryochloridaceae cyanobacterium CSU_3_4]